MVIPRIFKFYFVLLYCCRFITFGLVLIIVLSRHFIRMRAIQKGKTYLINRKYQIIISRYSSHYFIKLVGFMPIYTINLNIVSFYMIFSFLDLGSIRSVTSLN